MDPIFPTDSHPFDPPYCPSRTCPSRRGERPFTFARAGSYRRKCAPQVVARFSCRVCGRGFSTQTFKLSYGLHRPEITGAIHDTFVSKVTMRQAARTVGCTRRTVLHRLHLLARHAWRVHKTVLARVRAAGGMWGEFLLDELETFESSRRLQPVTMPILIERASRFALHAEVGTLPPRGRLPKHLLERRAQLEARDGKRVNGSRLAVRKCFAVLGAVASATGSLIVTTDRKSTYPSLLRKTIRRTFAHSRRCSKAARTTLNPLFPINNTLAMLRDGVSRLVRRSWGASKRRERLRRHAWIWIGYRNYVRPWKNSARHETSAMVLGVVSEMFTRDGFLKFMPMPLALVLRADAARRAETVTEPVTAESPAA